MSCHTDQWPIKQGTWKGRTHRWQKKDTFSSRPTAETNGGHHSGSLQDICQRLTRFQPGGARTNPLKIIALLSLKVKDLLLKKGNNGTLTLLAILCGCNATVLCSGVKGASQFALGQRVIIWEVGVTSDSDPAGHGGQLGYHYRSGWLWWTRQCLWFSVTSAPKRGFFH